MSQGLMEALGPKGVGLIWVGNAASSPLQPTDR